MRAHRSTGADCRGTLAALVASGAAPNSRASPSHAAVPGAALAPPSRPRSASPQHGHAPRCPGPHNMATTASLTPSKPHPRTYQSDLRTDGADPTDGRLGVSLPSDAGQRPAGSRCSYDPTSSERAGRRRHTHSRNQRRRIGRYQADPYEACRAVVQPASPIHGDRLATRTSAVAVPSALAAGNPSGPRPGPAAAGPRPARSPSRSPRSARGRAARRAAPAAPTARPPSPPAVASRSVSGRGGGEPPSSAAGTVSTASPARGRQRPAPLRVPPRRHRRAAAARPARPSSSARRDRHVARRRRTTGNLRTDQHVPRQHGPQRGPRPVRTAWRSRTRRAGSSRTSRARNAPASARPRHADRRYVRPSASRNVALARRSAGAGAGWPGRTARRPSGPGWPARRRRTARRRR